MFIVLPCSAKTFSVDMGGGHVFVALSNGCSDVLSALNNYLKNPDLLAVSCEVDPLVPPFPRVIRFQNGMMWEIQGMTETGVPDSCVPSVRTIAPCPSGFAPAVMSPLELSAVDAYESQFDTMPLQDMLYSIGVCFFALLGIAVGVKLL
jgi:hypothetical protein